MPHAPVLEETLRLRFLGLVKVATVSPHMCLYIIIIYIYIYNIDITIYRIYTVATWT